MKLLRALVLQKTLKLYLSSTETPLSFHAFLNYPTGYMLAPCGPHEPPIKQPALTHHGRIQTCRLAAAQIETV